MIKKLFVIFILGLLTANLFIVAMPQKASAATAKWIDHARIEYDGKLLTDIEPFDETIEYTLDGCPKIQIFDKATLSEKDSEGKCNKKTNISTISDQDKVNIIAYRKSADEIIGMGNGKAPSADQILQLFRRPPADERDDASTYYLVKSDGYLEKDFFVKTLSAGTLVSCIMVRGFPACTKEGKLANNGNIVTEIPGYENMNDIGGASTRNSSSVEGCLSKAGELAWIMCGIINGLAETTDGIFDMVVRPLLRSGSINITDRQDEIFVIWSNFRIYGNIMLIIALLVLVIGQTIGGGLIDSYTAKKMAPRLLGAAILINLSLYLVAFLVDATNVVGGGIDKLMTSPLSTIGGLNFTINGASAGVGLGATALIATGFIIWTGPLIAFLLLFILLPAVMAVIAVVITLVLRRGIIIFLILISPVAFALYCLPNTEKYFKKWWDTLFKTLLVYPLVVMLFGVAKILSVTINNGNSTGGVSDFFGNLLSMIALIIPLFLIPFAFKMSGGIIGGIYGQLSGVGKKATELIKGNVNNPASLRRLAMKNLKSAYIGTRGGMGDAMDRQYLKLGKKLVVDKTGTWVPHSETGEKQYRQARNLSRGRRVARSLLTRGSRLAVSPGLEYQRSKLNQEEAERVAIEQTFGADKSIRSMWARRKEDGRYYSYIDDKEVAEADVRRAQGNLSNTSALQEALSYEMTKVPNDEAYTKLQTRFEELANDQGWSEDEAIYMWLGSAWKNKTIRLEQKHRILKRGADGKLRFDKINYKAFAEEFGMKIRAYEAGGFQASTFGAMDECMEDAVAKGRAKPGGVSTEKLDEDSDELLTLRNLYQGITNLESPITGAPPSGAAPAPAAAPAAGAAPAPATAPTGIGATIMSFGASGMTAAAAERSAAKIKALAELDPRIKNLPTNLGFHNPT